MSTNSRVDHWFDRIERLELPICLYFNRANNIQSINKFFKIVSRLGDGAFWYCIIALTILSYGKPAVIPALHVLLTSALGVIIYKFLKELLVRERPFITHEVIRCDSRALDRYSFPSGHTLHALSFSIMLVFYYPGLVWIAFPFAALVAISRFVLGLHYISDVLIGGLLGAILAAASLQLHPYLF